MLLATLAVLAVGTPMAASPAWAKNGILKIATLNTWNVNEPFQARIDHAIDVLRDEAPDVIALQEIYLDGAGVPFRADRRVADALHMDAIAHGAATVPLGDGSATEGLALLSRFPIVSSSFVSLPATSGGNGRIVLGGTVSSPFGLVDVYTTHLSTNASERQAQVEAALRFVQSTPHQQPPLLLGDLNSTPISIPVLALTGALSLNGVRGDFTDVWASLRPGDDGPTFATANAHGQPLDRRFDYVMVGRGSASSPTNGALIEIHRAFDTPDASGVFPSDHLGLVASVGFDGETPPHPHGGGGCHVGDGRDTGALAGTAMGCVLGCLAWRTSTRKRRSHGHPPCEGRSPDVKRSAPGRPRAGAESRPRRTE